MVGAGPAGLVTARALQRVGIDFEVLERGEGVGGLWRFGSPESTIYESTRMISSKTETAFRELSMSPDVSTYPSHTEALGYLRDYADRHDLVRHVVFGAEVERISAADNGTFVTTVQGERRAYAGVIVATGHHWSPRLPEISGTFAGPIIHSSDYRCPAPFEGKRVVVVGAGNSGCDIAAEVSRHASTTFHSFGCTPDLLPRFIAGRPTDQLLDVMERWRLPLPLRRSVRRTARWLVNGTLSGNGLHDRPASVRRLVLNQELANCLHNGTVKPRAPLIRYDGSRVTFEDQTTEEADVVILATGYSVSLPTIEHWRSPDEGMSQLVDLIFDPGCRALFFVGLIQPAGGAWPLFEEQADLVSSFIALSSSRPDAADRFWSERIEKSSRRYGSLANSSTSSLRVDRGRYRRHVNRLRRRLNG